MSTLTGTAARKVSRGLDDRMASANFMRRAMNKVFPDHWSFLLGEIALYSFVILLLTGTYLTFFYDASMTETVYNGSYAPLHGVQMSQAYASTIHLSFDVRAGLVFRQIHHWAALLFVAAIVVHLCRIFFTGAFRKPREMNWLIGVLLLILAILEGFAGYSLPDDLLSGTGLRIAYSIAESLPVIGTWAAFLVFGGEFPGESIIPRLYVIHILLVPGVLLALISAHMGILWHQKHTQFRGPGRTEHNVVGSRMYPVFAAKTGAFFMIVFGMCALLGGLAQINPVWLYGPYDPAQVSAASQPDWYVGFLDGSTRLFLPWEFRGFGVTLSPLFWPAIVFAGMVFTLLMVYPWLESFLTKDHDYHNLLDKPRDNPKRTAVGVGVLSFYVVLVISGGNDVIATTFSISLNTMTWAGRVGLFVVPPIAYFWTKRVCEALQRHDHELEEHGIETGIIRQLPSGEFVEVTIPKPVAPHIELTPVPPDNLTSHEVETKGGVLDRAGRAMKDFFVERGDEEGSHTPEENVGGRRS
ncbi:MAG TPA: ubiquinol-cytochrome c reductase cytochrome b subunit [Frankiaceae bacterium]|nr:ubiquinol-cytochrome c reductase cytochrome b subunit [Frankiaceae bacterium]